MKGKQKNPLHTEGKRLTLPLALTGGFSLFLTLYAGLFVMLAFTNFLENATAGALPLKPFERTFQGLIFADTYLGHCYPSPRSFNALPSTGQTDGGQNLYRLYNQIKQASRIFEKFKRSSAARSVAQLLQVSGMLRPYDQPSGLRPGYGNAGEGQTGRHADRSWTRRDSLQPGFPVLQWH